MRVIPVPCLSDNYAYLVARDGSRDASSSGETPKPPREAFVVDPSESEPVIAALEREGLSLVAIVNTHHHHDHVGGNDALLARFGALPVYAHVSDRGRVPGQTHDVEDGMDFSVAGLTLHPIHVPGHTTGAVAYVVGGAVFTGDTLFVAGCGRIFEGTPEMMHTSLADKLGRLPKETRVYCGHEYTLSNLRFALHAEPDNADAAAKLKTAEAARARGEATVPSTIGEELATNPFLRSASPSLAARFPGANDVEVFAATRKAKDSFR